MASPNNRDLLTSFSPGSDFFAISSGDGRIKVRFPARFSRSRRLVRCFWFDGVNGFSYIYFFSDLGHLERPFTDRICWYNGFWWVWVAFWEQKRAPFSGLYLYEVGTTGEQGTFSTNITNKHYSYPLFYANFIFHKGCTPLPFLCTCFSHLMYSLKSEPQLAYPRFW